MTTLVHFQWLPGDDWRHYLQFDEQLGCARDEQDDCWLQRGKQELHQQKSPKAESGASGVGRYFKRREKAELCQETDGRATKFGNLKNS